MSKAEELRALFERRKEVWGGLGLGQNIPIQLQLFQVELLLEILEQLNRLNEPKEAS